VNGSEHSKRTALPLALAAARLGISSDALRMRLRRGKAKGFKRDGRLFVYLNEQPNKPVRLPAGAGEQEGVEGSRPGEHGPGAEAVHTKGEPAPAPGETAGVEPDSLPEQSLPVIVEFQKVELNRLLRDNTRLNRRLDQLMDEIRHLREMQQREQVLRQQDQVLRQQVQGTLERLTERLPLPGRSNALGAVSDTHGASESALPVSPPEPGASKSPLDAPYAYASGERIGEGTGQGPPEQSPREQDPLDQSPAQQGPLEQSPEEGNARATELAEILREVGESLRGLDAAPARMPDVPTMPSAAPTEHRSRDTAETGIGTGPRQRAGGTACRIPAELAESSDDDEARLLEILGRMGPSAEDRRTAARIMKRLLRSRGPASSRSSKS
jgi:hypothetical protein